MAKHIVVSKFVTAGDMSGDFTSNAIDCRYMDNAAIQCVWTGSDAVGVMVISGSVDGVNYTPLTFSSSLAVTGTADSLLVELNQTGCAWLKVMFDFTSGTQGLMDVWVCMKDLSS